MIVVDASTVVELLTDSRGMALKVRDRLAQDTEWYGPDHVFVETVNALRGLWLGRHFDGEQFDAQLRALDSLRIASVPVRLVLTRVRALAANATAYDAAYVALAEHLGAPLVTFDSKLARIPGSTARVDVLGRAEPPG